TVILLGIVAIGVATRRYYYNFFKGPFPIDRDHLLSQAADPSSWKSYFLVDFKKVGNTGAVETVTDHGVTTKSNFVVALAGEKVLLIKEPEKQSSTVLSG